MATLSLKFLKNYSSASNYHAQGFVPSPTSGKVCPLLLFRFKLRKFKLKIAKKKKVKLIAEMKIKYKEGMDGGGQSSRLISSSADEIG